MSEITKLYENAGIEKEVIKGCYDYYSKLGIDIWKENDCRGKNCDTCKKDKSIKRYPPFTAEKQLELIKWLSDTDYYIHNIYKTIDTKEYFIDNYYYDMQTDNFEETLAGFINKHWQDLTEEEKQQVKGILEWEINTL